MKKIILLSIFIITAFCAPFNAIYLKNTKLLDKNQALLKLELASHIFLLSLRPCKFDYSKLCSENPQLNQSLQSWGKAGFDAKLQASLKKLQAKGVKIIISFHPEPNFYKAVARNPRLYLSLAQSFSEFFNFYKINGVEYLYGPPRLVRTNTIALINFFKTLRQKLGKGAILGISPRYEQLDAHGVKGLFNIKKSKDFLALLDFVNIKYFDFKESILTPKNLINFYKKQSLLIPPQKLIISVALGSSKDKWGFTPAQLAKDIIAPILHSGYFGGICGYSFSQNDFYGQDYLLTMNRLFLANEHGLIFPQTVLASDLSYLYIPFSGAFYFKKEHFNKDRQIPKKQDIKSILKVGRAYVFWKNDGFFLRFPRKNYNEPFKRFFKPHEEVLKLFVSKNLLYILTSLGLYSSDLEGRVKFTLRAKPEFRQFLNAASTKDGILLGFKSSVYGFSKELKPKNKGLPKDPKLLSLSVHNNCARVYSLKANKFFYTTNGGESWHDYQNTGRFFSCD